MARVAMDKVEKFWCSVSPEPNSGCWLWSGPLWPNGYASHQFGGRGNKAVLAHRFSYELHKGPVPEGLDLDHLCRMRCCVNPDHLEPVTRKVNINRSGLVGKWYRGDVCKYGHPFDLLNTYRGRDGFRQCRICRAKRDLERKIRKRAKQ